MKLDEAFTLAEELITEGKLFLEPLANFISRKIDQGIGITEIAKSIISLGQGNSISISNRMISVSIDGHKGNNSLRDELCVAIGNPSKNKKVDMILKELKRLLEIEAKKKFPNWNGTVYGIDAA